MKNLYQFLLESHQNTQSYWDGHIHLFDHNGFINKDLINPTHKCVCFADIAFRYLDKYLNNEIINYYDDFITKYYDPTKHILLATGITSEEIISIYKKYPTYIKGFGELKCYNKWKNDKLPYDDLKWIQPLLNFNQKLKLPIYIHYNLDNPKRRKVFEKLLNIYDMPFVLCHCGMVDNFDNQYIYSFVKDLLNKYQNLYIDISYFNSCEFFLSNPGLLLQLPLDRIIIGSDINPIINDVVENPIRQKDDCYKNMINLYQYYDFSKSIKQLFNIKDDKCEKLIQLYHDKINEFSRHEKIHLLSRGNLIGMYSKNEIKNGYKYNLKAIDDIINMISNQDWDKCIKKYVLIGYEKPGRKQNIGKLFKNVDDQYKQFLCLISLLELVYTFKRVDLLEELDKEKIKSVLLKNKNIISKCISDDKYDFKHKAATKYINTLFFIYNLKPYLSVLNNMVDEKVYDDIIVYYNNLYKQEPNVTTLYGITHILIGSSDFYIKQIPSKYECLLNCLYDATQNINIFESLTLDLQIEILLCCKLFGTQIHIPMDKYITYDNLEENEHTNMLFILLNRYSLKKP